MDHDTQAVLPPPRTADVPAADAAPPPERWRTALRTVGGLFVTAGLVLLLFVVHQLYVTDVMSGRAR